jgi:NAD(P)-dependent dehydrogenase (short-subunit alcohol dehydrogenase family)
VRVHEQDVSVLEKALAVNVRGTWLGMKHSIRQMLSQQPDEQGTRGRVVNMGSIYSKVGSVGSTCYCASKGAIIQLTRAAALEYGEDGITINAVLPAFTESNMTEVLYRNKGEVQVAQLIRELHPLGRVGRAEEVANAVVYLSGNGASFVTGIGLPVDGGFLSR